MAITANRIKGFGLAIAIGADANALILHWRRLRVVPKISSENPQGADADFVQRVVDLRDCDLQLEGFLGASNNLTAWPDLADEVLHISVKKGSDALIRADINNTALWGKWRVKELPQEFSKDSATLNMTLECGYID